MQLGPGLDRFAFILRSLKTQEELRPCGRCTGRGSWSSRAYSPKEERVEHLAAEIERSRGTKNRSRWVNTPEAFVERDEKEEQARGQDVSGTFTARTSSSVAGT